MVIDCNSDCRVNWCVLCVDSQEESTGQVEGGAAAREAKRPRAATRRGPVTPQQRRFQDRRKNNQKRCVIAAVLSRTPNKLDSYVMIQPISHKSACPMVCMLNILCLRI